MIANETKTDTILRVGVEAAQIGYIVTVYRKKAGKGDLVTYPYGPTTKTADAAYNHASITANSVGKYGRYVGTRGEWTITVKGKKITATRAVAC